jgi:hypothetical protein
VILTIPQSDREVICLARIGNHEMPTSPAALRARALINAERTRRGGKWIVTLSGGLKAIVFGDEISVRSERVA